MHKAFQKLGTSSRKASVGGSKAVHQQSRVATVSSQCSLGESPRRALDASRSSRVHGFKGLNRRVVDRLRQQSRTMSLEAVQTPAAPTQQTLGMKVVDVNLGDRSYPIYIGTGLLNQGELLRKHISGKRVLIVTNETIAPLYLEQ